MPQLLTKDTKEQQQNLARYCRTGNTPNLNGVTEGRLHHYRRLVYNVVDDTLSTAYPLTKNLLEEEEWDDMVDYFFSNHKCQSHKVWEMPLELYEFMCGIDSSLKEKYPFFTELLWFEWLEVKLFMMEDMEVEECRSTGDFASNSMAFTSEATLEKLNYPLHKKRAKDITDADKGSYYVLIYRDTEGSVQFIDLSVFYAWLLEQLMVTGMTVNKIVPLAASIFKLTEAEIEAHSVSFLKTLKDKGFLLGFK